MFALKEDLRLKERHPDTVGWREFSAIERRFPHIAHNLVSHWRQGDIDSYMDSLLIDSRGDRRGFPEEVLEELVFLAGIRWHFTHETLRPIDDTRLEPFRFGVTDYDANHTQTTKGGWLLV